MPTPTQATYICQKCSNTWEVYILDEWGDEEDETLGHHVVEGYVNCPKCSSYDTRLFERSS